MWSPDPACDTIAVVGAGFSGTALAHRLLRAVDWHGRLLLIERAGRCGPGLAYGVLTDTAMLNVPAGNMSIEEDRPDDFVTYLHSLGVNAQRHDFVPRRLYGHYLRERLDLAAQSTSAQHRFVRVQGAARSLEQDGSRAGYAITIDDGRRLVADRVVLATGHARRAPLPELAALEGTPHYTHDPWALLPSSRPGGRVLVVGTGLTMADVVTELLNRPSAPGKILAVSRRGLVPNERLPFAAGGPPAAPEASAIVPGASSRRLLSAVRRAVREVEMRGGDWREVMAALRTRTPPLWHELPLAERRRFLRHIQPYWDVHRHLLPPGTAEVLRAARESGRLDCRAARIVDATASRKGVKVALRNRGPGRLEWLTVDMIVNCTGPVGNPALDDSRLTQGLLATGLLTPDPTGCGVAVDAQCRLLDRDGVAVQGLHYLGPWLRARDWEMTAVPDLRRAATALAGHLVASVAAPSASRAAAARP